MSAGDADDRLISRVLSTEEELGPKDAATIRRLMISYGIIEEAYELYKKKWIDNEAWEQWNSWLKAICRHPHFAKIHSATTGMFDKEFQDHVSRLLTSDSSGQTSGISQR